MGICEYSKQREKALASVVKNGPAGGPEKARKGRYDI